MGQNNEWESKKDLGDFWNPTKTAEGTPRYKGDKNDILDGYYVDKRENVGDNNANVYTLQSKEGIKKQMWGTKSLNDQMADIRFGQYIRIQWHGKELTQEGEKKFKSVETCTNTKMAFHNYEVFVNKNIPMLAVNKPANDGFESVAKNEKPVAQGSTAGQNFSAKEEDDLPF